jgi:shikimate kinase
VNPVAPRVVLVGAPGAGKTTVGKILADRLGVEFHDTDAGIEAAEGSTVSDIFINHGEAYFRSLERAQVATMVAEHDGVVALGGGAVLDPDTREVLKGAPTIWLRVGLGDALSRVGMNQARPLLLGNVRGTLLRLLDERSPFYEQVATATVDTDGISAPEIATAVLLALQDR